MRGELSQPQHINVLFDEGGLGDQIARLPAVKYVLENWKHVWIHLYVPDYCLELANHLLPQTKYPQLFTKPLSRFNGQGFNPNLPGYRTYTLNHTSLRTHLTDHGFHMIADTTPADTRDKDYIQVRPAELPAVPLPEDFVVITTGYTAKVRMWKSSEVNKVISWVKEVSGAEVVFLGTQGAEYDDGIAFHKGINLIGQTSLLEAVSVMTKARAVVGVDNGLIHLAGCTDTPIVAGYTTVDPIYRIPKRSRFLGGRVLVVTPSNSLGCRFCQNKMHYLYDHDFRDCYYKDLKCLDEMAGEKFIRQLEALV